MTVEKVEVRKLTPKDGHHLKNIHSGEVFENFIYLPKSLTADDFTEITAEEYQQIKTEELKEAESEETL